MKTLALLIFPGVQSLDVAGPMDVLAEANSYVAPGDGYRLVTIGSEATPMRASNGQWLGADYSMQDVLPPLDALLVPGAPDLATRPARADISVWLRAVTEPLPRFGSICTGAFLLGHAGLLDGKRASTHWSDAAQLAAQFPLAQVEPDRIHVRDGRLVTSAGVTAGIDLALALVAEDHGAKVALAVAKRLLVVAQRQGGQSQFSPYLSKIEDEGGFVGAIQLYVVEHLAEALSVERLAAAAGMSGRTFARQFVAETGVTPAEFVQRARIDAARRLLELSQEPLKTIAYRCGFGSAARMRHVFSERFAISPAQYRDSFRRDG